jgi:cytochrome c-type biogenesis protein CcmH
MSGMIGFWIGAAALAGGAALLVMLFARRAAPQGADQNPALAVHRRQLLEIDALVERGVMGEADQAAARAEAARRLLSTAALNETPERAGAADSRRIVAGVALLAAAGALWLYLLVGAPGAPDRPYQARVAAWRARDPSTLDPAQMAAVLKSLASERPSDPQVWAFLGRAEMASGDAYGAQKAFRRAAALAPADADDQAGIGQALLAAADGKPSPEADAAFARALALDPKNLPARYMLGRARIAAGDRSGGLALWRSLEADLPTDDPRKAGLVSEIARIAAGGPLEAPDVPAAPDPAAGRAASGFIRAMVARQAAELVKHPNDPEGWARLVRSYGVLHDAAAQADALARARRQFTATPAVLGPIEAEAKAHPAR